MTDTNTPHDDDEPLAAESAEAVEAEIEAAEAEAEAGEEKSVEQLTAELDDLRDRLLRAVAEAANTRKRAARDVQDTREYAITGFARDMLDIADNLSRATQAISATARDTLSDEVRTLIEGVEMTERRLHSSLERHGVKQVNPAAGDALDPNIHQAAAQIPAEQPKGTIAHVMQPGYVIGGRTLRAAMVVVSAGPAATPPGGEDKSGGSVDVSA